MASGLKMYVRTPYEELVPIIDTIKTENQECVEVVFSNGTSRKVSKTHRFMNLDGKEVYASEASKVRTKEGTLEVLSNKDIGKHDVYDISIPYPHWYLDQNDLIHHNCGKTTFLIQQAADWLEAGKNVLYFTLEVAENVIRERIDVCLFDMTFDQLKSLQKNQYVNRVKALRDKTQGELVIKEFPSGSAHIGHFRHVIEELKIKKDFKPDVIIIDYITIAASSKLPANAKGNTNTYYTSVSEEFRSLGVEYDVPVWTAAQFGRAGQSASDVDMTDVGLALGIAATADFMVSFMMPEEMQERNQAIGKVLKNRYANKAHIRKFLIGINNDLQKFYDVDASEQSAVMNNEELAQMNKQVKDSPVFDSSNTGSTNMSQWSF